MKRSPFYSAVIFAVFFLLAIQVFARPSRDTSASFELLIGAAMSLRDVTVDLAAAYNAINPHITLTFTYASSGVLQTQIEEGAPIDIFMSAAIAQMRNLEGRGLIYGQSRNLLRNSVALIVPADSQAGIRGFADLTHTSIRLIGLGDPAAMPIGTFAHNIFTSLGIADQVYSKAVLASEVRQILTWVEMGEVDAGVVFMTDAITSERIRVVEVADSSLHTPSINPVGIVAGSPSKAEAQRFMDFLFSPQARAIFERHGFLMY